MTPTETPGLCWSGNADFGPVVLAGIEKVRAEFGERDLSKRRSWPSRPSRIWFERAQPVEQGRPTSDSWN